MLAAKKTISSLYTVTQMNTAQMPPVWCNQLFVMGLGAAHTALFPPLHGIHKTAKKGARRYPIRHRDGATGIP